MGSAGAKVASILQGDADVYVHAGGQYEWKAPHPLPWREPPDYTPPASMAPPCVTTAKTRCCPIC